MIQIDIDGKKYLGPEPGKWDQLTIDKAIELSKVIRGIPPKLRKMYDDWIKGETFDYSDWTDEDTLRNHPRFFTRVIETLYSLPEGALQLTLGNVNEIQSFYNSFCQKFVLGIIHLPVDFEPLNMLEFRYRGARYFMPAPFETYKEEIPLGLAAGDQITEALDILNISRELQEVRWKSCRCWWRRSVFLPARSTIVRWCWNAVSRSVDCLCLSHWSFFLLHQFLDRCSSIWPSLRDNGGGGDRDAYDKSGLERFGYRGTLLSIFGWDKSTHKKSKRLN
jgi:hypothetical protein